MYLKLTDGAREPGFLLESIEGGMRIARYSFIGSDPIYSITFRDGRIDGLPEEFPDAYDDPLEALEEILGRSVMVKSDSVLHQEKFDLA